MLPLFILFMLKMSSSNAKYNYSQVNQILAKNSFNKEDTNNYNFFGAGSAVMSYFDNDYYVLLTEEERYNKDKNYYFKQWTLPGGCFDKEIDNNSFETAIRELIEEILNLKLDASILNKIYNELKNYNKSYIITETNLSYISHAITYFFNSKILNTIFKILDENNIECKIMKSGSWKTYFHSNLYQICNDRLYVSEKPSDSLNEVKRIRCVKLSDLNNYKLRFLLKNQINNGIFDWFNGNKNNLKNFIKITK